MPTRHLAAVYTVDAAAAAAAELDNYNSDVSTVTVWFALDNHNCDTQESPAETRAGNYDYVARDNVDGVGVDIYKKDKDKEDTDFAALTGLGVTINPGALLIPSVQLSY